MKRLMLAGCLVACTGCAGLVGQGIGAGDRGRILISADRDGMRALGDSLTGLVTTGKAAPNQDDAHHELRRGQTEVERVKALIKIGDKYNNAEVE